MEEILKELLSEVRSLKDGQEQIIKRLDNLESSHTALANTVDKMETKIDERFTKVDERFTKIDGRITKIDERFTKIDRRFTKLETKVDNLNNKVDYLNNKVDYLNNKVDNLQGQLQENTAILHALEHRSQVQGAETEGLKLGTATKVAVERIETKLDLLNTRLFQQETELQSIKRAK